MDEKKIYSWLGLSMRAGKLVSGEDTTLRDVKKERVHLVLIASDASENTKKLFSDKCSFRNIDCMVFGTKDAIGQSIGKGPRAVVGLKDEKISSIVRTILGGGIDGQNEH